MPRRLAASALALALALALTGLAAAAAGGYGSHGDVHATHFCKGSHVWCPARNKCGPPHECRGLGRPSTPPCRKGTVRCGKACVSPLRFTTDENVRAARWGTCSCG